MDAEQIFHTGNSFLRLGIIALRGAEDLAHKIDKFLVDWAAMGPEARDTFIIGAECPRFASGDGKGLLKQSVRGMDIYIIVDVGNYNCTYNIFGHLNHMSPDDHFADLKRIIQAASGKASSISVIMPQLYGSRQHRRTARESLDCAVALQELQAMGVKNVITFDTHDERVQNAVPLMGFDSLMPHYQVLKALFKRYPDISTRSENFMVVSPDEGAMNRNMYYSSVLGVNLGMFYKRRDYSRVVKGRNPIIAHEYLGEKVDGKTILVADDIISSGESMLDIAYYMKKRNAARFFATATYALFTNGLSLFDKAYEDGAIDCVFGTNMTYISGELRRRPWFCEVDCSKYIAYIIAAMNHNVSVSALLDPHAKIRNLIETYHSNQH
jgi:ribose-phosphate pyrophosphokinase